MEWIIFIISVLGIFGLAILGNYTDDMRSEKKRKKLKKEYEKEVVEVHKYKYRLYMTDGYRPDYSMRYFTTELFDEYIDRFMFKEETILINGIYINPIHIVRVELLEDEAFKINPIYDEERLFRYTYYADNTVKRRMVNEDNQGGEL